MNELGNFKYNILFKKIVFESISKNQIATLLTGLILIITNCSIFLPRNQKSFFTKDHRLKVRLIKDDDSWKQLLVFIEKVVEAEFHKEPTLKQKFDMRVRKYNKTNYGLIEFSKDEKEIKFNDNLADGISAKDIEEEKKKREEKEKNRENLSKAVQGDIAGLAVDVIANSLEVESENYQSQYTSLSTFDNFWIKDKKNWTLNYAGMILETFDEEGKASSLLLEFKISSDGKFIKLSPIYFKADRVKTKVLANAYYWPWIWFMKTDENVEFIYNFKINAQWVKVTDKKNFENQNSIVGNVTLKIDSYSLKSNSLESLHIDRLSNIETDWFPVIPRSDGIISNLNNKAGNFSILVTVTERDTSQASKSIDSASSFLKENKARMKEYIENNKK